MTTALDVLETDTDLNMHYDLSKLTWGRRGTNKAVRKALRSLEADSPLFSRAVTQETICDLEAEWLKSSIASCADLIRLSLHHTAPSGKDSDERGANDERIQAAKDILRIFTDHGKLPADCIDNTESVSAVADKMNTCWSRKHAAPALLQGFERSLFTRIKLEQQYHAHQREIDDLIEQVQRQREMVAERASLLSSYQDEPTLTQGGDISAMSGELERHMSDQLLPVREKVASPSKTMEDVQDLLKLLREHGEMQTTLLIAQDDLLRCHAVGASMFNNETKTREDPVLPE